MSEISIKEGNAIIKKYMGLPTSKSRGVRFAGGTEEVEWTLDYNSDWNSIMHVGKKVREEILKDQNTKHMKFWMAICVGLYTFDIEKTWHSIILYIQFKN